MRPPTSRWLAAVLVFLLAFALSLGCRDDRGAGRAPPAAGAASARRYTVRGEVVRLPAAAGGQLSLRHEPIDDFADATGKVVGMRSMVMPFDVAPGVSLEGLAPGDKVEVVLAIDFATPTSRIEALRKLAPGTVLRVGAPGR